jgi:hypothetical protein
VIGESRHGKDPEARLAALREAVLARTRQVQMLFGMRTDEGTAAVAELRKIERGRWLRVLP